MRLYLNLYYPHPEDLALAFNLGFHGVRTGPESRWDVEEVVRAVEVTPLECLFLTRDADAAVKLGVRIEGNPRFALELGNEEDSKRTPMEYQRWLTGIVPHVPESVRLFTAGITTPDKRRLAWLEEVYAIGVPTRLGTCLHTYRSDREPQWAHPGFKSRFDEFAALRRIVGNRRIVNSEIGWHTCESKRRRNGLAGLLGATERVRFTEQQCANFIAEEARINKLAGVDVMVVYQVGSGPNPAYYEDNFGIRRFDGTLRVVAERIRGIAEEVA